MVTSFAVILVPHLVSGIYVSDFTTAVCIALVLGLLNTLVRPILFWITLPISILTLGLFTLILNALMFQLAAHFVDGVSVASFGAAFWASLWVSFISWILAPKKIHVQTYSSSGRRVRDV